MKTVQAAGEEIRLGRQGESGVRVIRFAREGAGNAVLAVRRCGEETCYLKSVTVTEDAVWWTVDGADTGVPGEGECELRFMDGERVLKSRVWRTWVEPAMASACGEVPGAAADWVETTAAYAGAARAAADQAAASAREAKGAGAAGRLENLYAGAAEALTDDRPGRVMTGSLMKTVAGDRTGKRAAVIRRIRGKSEIRNGKLVNARRVTVIATGLNQWNEKWKKGYWSANGTFSRNTAGYVSSEEAIPVMGGCDYWFTSPVNLYIAYFDAQMGFIRRDGQRSSSVFTTPEDCAYVHISTVVGYGGTYLQDICVNVSGQRNGEYEPYRETRRTVEAEDWFADGMKQAGAICDELTETECIRRVGTRPYREGDETDASVVTDGTDTNYALTGEERTAGGMNGMLIAWKEGTLRLETEGAQAEVVLRVCEPGEGEWVSAESVREMLALIGQSVGRNWDLRWDEEEGRWKTEELRA